MGVQVRFSDQEAAGIFVALASAEVLLASVYLLIHGDYIDIPWWSLRQMVDMDAEISIATWFSSIQYFVVAVILYAAAKNNLRRVHVSSAYLIFGALLFLVLSVDESAALHEKITNAAKSIKQDWMLINGHAAWLAVYATLFVLAVVVCIRQLLSLWKYYRTEALIGMCGVIVLATGAVGLEILSYRFMAAGGRAYVMIVTGEEFLEMLGVSIVLYAVVRLATRLTMPTTQGQGRGLA